MSKDFLTAEWRKLAFANYTIDPEILLKYVPAGTELDSFNDNYYISLVGFKFCNTRLKGFRIPFHTDFVEVNLRFYVRYKESITWKRGVVFLKEIVPKPAITFIANTIYKENYATMPMRHKWIETTETLNVAYSWKNKDWHNFEIEADLTPTEILSGSHEEFITEHYWGYAKASANRTSEYEITHPRWKLYPVRSFKINVDFGQVYKPEFSFLNSHTPETVFLAEGSEISIKPGKFF